MYQRVKLPALHLMMLHVPQWIIFDVIMISMWEIYNFNYFYILCCLLIPSLFSVSQNGTKAPQAAGKIHTDFEKGFIMAEVNGIVYDGEQQAWLGFEISDASFIIITLSIVAGDEI